MAYPPDRVRSKAACLTQIEEAAREGVAPDELLRAVQAYATGRAGFTRSKVCFSDNRFQSRRWQGYLVDISAERERAHALSADHCSRLALDQ